MPRLRLSILLLLLCAAATPALPAQSNARPDYKHQHKSAQKYQRSILKQQRKQANSEARRAKAYRKQHATE